jgi:PAS domain S-box-containing protein
LLSGLAADFFFIPPPHRFAMGVADVASTVVFIVVGAMLVAVVSLLNEAVDRLTQQAAMTKHVLEVQPVGIVLADEQGVINFVNSRIEKDVGYDRKELRGRTMDILVPEEHRGERDNLRYYMLNYPEQIHPDRDFALQRKDGSLVPIEVGITAFQGFGFVGSLATVANLTERKEIARRELIANEVRQGFGSTLLIDLARGFATQVDMNYDPDGISYELRADLARICDGGELSEDVTSGRQRAGELHAIRKVGWAFSRLMLEAGVFRNVGNGSLAVVGSRPECGR